MLHCPLDLADILFRNGRDRAQTKPRHFLSAEPLEILLEAQEVCRTRKVTFRPGTLDLEYILNNRERHTVASLEKHYWQRFHAAPRSDPDLCFFLGDNPKFSKSWSGTSGKIPTLRRNGSKIWFPAKQRWLTASERFLGGLSLALEPKHPLAEMLLYSHPRLSTLGFPMRESMARALGVSTVAVKDPKRATQLAGNCMSFNTAAVIHMIALSCFSFPKRA